MSLGYSFVKAEDGKFYRNPVWEGENWTLFLDDGEVNLKVLATADNGKAINEARARHIPVGKAEDKHVATSPFKYPREPKNEWTKAKYMKEVTFMIMTITHVQPWGVPDTYDEVYDERPDLEGTYQGGM
jgi:hypothetical protein